MILLHDTQVKVHRLSYRTGYVAQLMMHMWAAYDAQGNLICCTSCGSTTWCTSYGARGNLIHCTNYGAHVNYSVLGGLSYRTNDLVDRLLLLVGCTVHRDAILLGLVPSESQLAVLAEGAAKGGTDLVSPINNTFGSEVDGLPMQCPECKMSSWSGAHH